MRIIVAIAFSLAIGGSAVAAGHERAAECRTVADLAKAIPDAKFTPLNAAAFHFIEGVYIMAPNTPMDLPKADGALLAVSKTNGMAVIWVRGKCIAQDVQTLPLPKEFVAKLRTLNPGVGETIDADSSDQDMHL